MDFTSFLSGFLGASPVEITASLAGFICVYLIIRRNVWCWPVGLLQVSLYVVVFYKVKLYSDMLLHVIYIFMQFYGWWNWVANRRDQGTVRIVGVNVRQLLAWAVVCLVFSLGLGWLMATHTDAALPYPDAFTTVASLVAQWLLSRRRLANWFFWIAVDIVAINIYWQKALYPTAVLYCVFLVMAVTGLLVWLREYRGHSGDQTLAAAVE